MTFLEYSHFRLIVAIGVCLLFHTNIQLAHAQSIPSSADPARVIKPFERDFSPSLEDDLNISEGNQTLLSAPEGAEGYRFVLKSLKIQGVNVYSETELQQLYTNKINQEINVSEIFDIANAISAKYRSDGYILTQAILPPQEIDDGLVTIRVVEGSVSDVRTTGLQHASSKLIQNILSGIKNSVAFNVRNLEKQLLLLNRMTGLRAYSVLEPSEDSEEGAIGVHIVFEENPKSYQISADNYGSRFVGPWQGAISARIPHAHKLHGEANIAVYTSPQTKELRFLSVSERLLLTSKGLTMDASARVSRSEPGDSLADVDLNTRYLSLRLNFEHPILLSRHKQFNIFTGLEYNNSESDVLSARFFDDRLRIIRLGFSGYSTQFLGGSLQGRATLSQGLNIFGARQSGSDDLSREQGRSNFTKVDARLSYRSRLAKAFGLNTTFSGQYSAHPLLSSEEFGYGGYALGRAYNNSEITGDSGVGFLAELSYYGWQQHKQTGIWPDFVPFTYYDIGKVWNRDRNSKPESGASAGLGVQMNWSNQASVRATVSIPLTREVVNPVHGNGKNPRFLLSFQRQF